MLFDFFFYGLLIFSTFISYNLIPFTTPSNKLLKGIKVLFVIFCGSLWLWQLLLWVLPKGSKIEEAIHLPRHLWMLDHAAFKDGEQKQKVAYGTQQRQYYQYYPAPSSSNQKNTVIFYIHGGGWCLGSPNQHKHLAHLLQKEGYTLIFPAYRLTPEFNYFDLQEDINAALTHSLEFLKTQGIHHPQLIIGGTSAGANLGCLLAYDENRWEKMNLDRSILQGVFSIVGALDIAKMEQTSTLLNYTGQPESATYQLANPVTWINQKDSFNFLCLHGKKDGLVDYAAAVSFCDKLNRVAPNRIDFQSFEQATHIDLGAAWYYDPAMNYGQDSILINWLNKISTPRRTTINLF
ncbi:alpha/beta hydrolase [Aureispira anguillae]|uniref:Alpha/beta hydrolase n=1 Tax=Aureispira anguillae TaxID=2864201 RepID=A0A915YLB2_9BACT|nr:alpha/beta hydrolase [Aureispira anguillae]BDS15335.1 alpha/beta hydrolase [Aureispira anguillae]